MANRSPELLDAQALHERRKNAKLEDAKDSKDVWGLALSGGGIRSATFCFGLLRGLARAGVLKRFDYLSTVSGGGYVGAAFGRLFAKGQDADTVQARLGSNDTILLWWLRNNGRYLTPAGARDMMQALASIVRNTLFSLIEAGLLALLGAGVMLVPYVVMALFQCNPGAAGPSDWPTNAQTTFGSAWLFALLVPVWIGSHSIFGYWYARDEPANTGAIVVGSTLSVLCAFGFGHAVHASLHTDPHGFAAWHMAYLTIASLLLTPATAYIFHNDSANQAELRLKHTKRLGWCLAWFGALLAVAAVDWISARAAAWLIRLHEERRAAAATGATGASLLALVAIARTWLPRLQKFLKSAPVKRVRLETLVNIVGLVLLAVFILLWAIAFQLFVHPDIHWRWWPEDGMPNPSVAHWMVIMIAIALFCCGTNRDVESLNLSSLHNFYRARLERAYVSTGNSQPPNARFPAPILETVTREITNRIAKLVAAVEGDDIPLRTYAPQEQGGPIHLLTCCVNQTVDDRTGLYNADRKGMALTVSSLGVETGTHAAVPFAQLCDDPGKPKDAQIDRKIGRLSRWVAISGAAAGSGMGSQTTPGLAALLFLSGVRLGFWTKNLLPRPQKTDERKLALPVRWFPKQAYLTCELLARFPGLGSPNWYVSDGGHFENTAVYPLLKRKLGFILVADCGADPDFGFDDLENLVRKAKIDYGASIRFLEPSDLEKCGVDHNFVVRCGSLAELTQQDGTQAVLVARIGYDDGSSGVLAVVKPRRLSDAPLEVTGYAKRNGKFPQQTTADQFFDESQWEAYHQLGLFMGAWFTPAALGELAQLTDASAKQPSA